TGANLNGADFTGAKIDGADLAGAMLANATIDDALLKNARNADKAVRGAGGRAGPAVQEFLKAARNAQNMNSSTEVIVGQETVTLLLHLSSNFGRLATIAAPTPVTFRAT